MLTFFSGPDSENNESGNDTNDPSGFFAGGEGIVGYDSCDNEKTKRTTAVNLMKKLKKLTKKKMMMTMILPMSSIIGLRKKL